MPKKCPFQHTDPYPIGLFLSLRKWSRGHHYKTKTQAETWRNTMHKVETSRHSVSPVASACIPPQFFLTTAIATGLACSHKSLHTTLCSIQVIGIMWGDPSCVRGRRQWCLVRHFFSSVCSGRSPHGNCLVPLCLPRIGCLCEWVDWSLLTCWTALHAVLPKRIDKMVVLSRPRQKMDKTALRTFSTSKHT